MTQTREGDDGPCLPHDLSVMNTYNEMTAGSKWVAVVVKNLTATLITIAKCVKITQVVAVNVPQVEVAPETLEELDEIQGIQQTRMSVEWRKWDFLPATGVIWPGGVVWQKNQAAARVLLAEYHDIFFLEPGKFGCTALAKHEIRVINDEPFKEKFQKIPPPMVDEVHAHVTEMLDVGAIHPSQSPWCNAILLVCKKDGGLWFWIDFHKLNVRTKKDSYPLP